MRIPLLTRPYYVDNIELKVQLTEWKEEGSHHRTYRGARKLALKLDNQ